MKFKITLLLLSLICTNIFAQKGKNMATNINHKQTTVNDEPALLITFDLNEAKDVPYYNVTIEAIVDGQKVKVDAVDGDVGTYIKKGSKKKVTWKIMRDVSSDDFTVEEIIVKAYPVESRVERNKDKKNIQKPNLPIGAGVLSIAGSGLGIVVWGLTQESQASADYDDYAKFRDPDDAFYTEIDITRDELYDQANKKHKTAQVIMSVGGAVILASGGMLVSRLIQRNKSSASNNDLQITPYVLVNNYSYQTKPYNGFGLKLSRKF